MKKSIIFYILAIAVLALIEFLDFPKSALGSSMQLGLIAVEFVLFMLGTKFRRKGQ